MKFFLFVKWVVTNELTEIALYLYFDNSVLFLNLLKFCGTSE